MFMVIASFSPFNSLTLKSSTPLWYSFCSPRRGCSFLFKKLEPNFCHKIIPYDFEFLPNKVECFGDHPNNLQMGTDFTASTVTEFTTGSPMCTRLHKTVVLPWNGNVLQNKAFSRISLTRKSSLVCVYSSCLATIRQHSEYENGRSRVV